MTTPPRFIMFAKEGVAYTNDDLKQLVFNLGKDTLSVWEIESCRMFDVTEEACIAWCDGKPGENAELDQDGFLDVPEIIKNLCPGWVAEEECKARDDMGELTVRRRDYQESQGVGLR